MTASAVLFLLLATVLAGRNAGHTEPPPAATAPTERGVNVRRFGALGNGVADDGPAIQAAITEALARNEEVYVPPGYYRTTRTLELSRPHGRVYSSLVGASMGATAIIYDGDPRQPILRIRGGYGIAVRDLTLHPERSSRKPAAGIAFPADAAHPSASDCTFERVQVEDCRVGLDFNRGTNRQVSEITLEACVVSGADEAAYRVEGWNALNYLFLNCSASKCGVGWWIERTNSVSIVGGSCSGIGTVLRANAGGIVSMRGVRVENSARLADLGPVLPNGSMGATGAPVEVSIEDTSFTPFTGKLAPDGHVIRISDPGPTRIANCSFRRGDIDFIPAPHTEGVLTVDNCVFDTSAGQGVRVHGTTHALVEVRACRVVDLSGHQTAVKILNGRL